MAEFVDLNLEKLIPAFEKIKKLELLSTEELNDFIRRCKHHEYKTAKRTKQARDFLDYANYLKEMLKVIKLNRKKRQIYEKFSKFIEKTLCLKIAFIYRICCDRFKKSEYFQKEIAFLKSQNMKGILTKTYTRFLCFHGRNPENHIDAANFELKFNKSSENARLILQMALRIFPKNIRVWASLFEVEIKYIKLLKNRKKHLMVTDEEKEEDKVMNFKLLEIVLEKALKEVPEEKHSELLAVFLDACQKSKIEGLNALIDKLKDQIENLLTTTSDEVCDDEDLFVEDVEMRESKKDQKDLEMEESKKEPKLEEKLKSSKNTIPEWKTQHFKQLPNAQQKTAFNNFVLEYGAKNVDCWISYLKFLLKTDALAIATLNKRAMFNLDKDLLKEFEFLWAKTIQNAELK